MKSSVIFFKGMQVLLPVLLALSILITWRGHNQPGGGFIGGLVAGIGLGLYAMAFSHQGLNRILKLISQWAASIGLIVAITAVLISPFLYQGLAMQGEWGEVPVLGWIGTPVLFDLGVYLVVLGTANLLFLTLIEDEKQ